MNASELVDLLLEVNVINVRDIDREISKLAASLTDPRAEKWFKRVPRFFLINIDRLLKEPYVHTKPEPWGIRAAKHYADPKGGWMPGRTPAEIPPEQLGKEWGEERLGGEPESCSRCAGQGRLKTIQHAETGERIQVPADPRHDPEDVRATYRECPECGGSGKKSGEQMKSAYSKLPPELKPEYLKKLSDVARAKVIERWLRRKFGIGLLEQDVYDPKKRTYTTQMHEPGVQKDIEQSFIPFKPKKAKAKRVHGEAPTKKELQPWMTAPEAEEKEFYHFDPIQFRRRELFGKLQTLVNYLNYMTNLSTKRDSEDKTERARAAEAENLLRRLVSMKPDDIQGFRDIMQDAYSFGSLVKEKPWQFTKDGQEIAKLDTLTMRKAIYPETVVALSKRGQPENTHTPDPQAEGMYYPAWCTKTVGHAEGYTEDGPLYFIDKAGKPYVLVHFPSRQCRNVQNTSVSDEVAAEIAPLFADRMRFPLDDITKIPILARHVGIPDQSVEVMRLPNGYKLMDLRTPIDLAREGVVMNHCVGNQMYQDRLNAGTHQYFSLRDPQNKGKVTIEVERPNTVRQMKGFSNSTSNPENVAALLRSIVQQNNWRVVGDESALRGR